MKQEAIRICVGSVVIITIVIFLLMDAFERYKGRGGGAS